MTQAGDDTETATLTGDALVTVATNTSYAEHIDAGITDDKGHTYFGRWCYQKVNGAYLNMLQIKKTESSNSSRIQLPAYGGAIQSIKLSVTNANGTSFADGTGAKTRLAIIKGNQYKTAEATKSENQVLVQGDANTETKEYEFDFTSLGSEYDGDGLYICSLDAPARIWSLEVVYKKPTTVDNRIETSIILDKSAITAELGSTVSLPSAQLKAADESNITDAIITWESNDETVAAFVDNTETGMKELNAKKVGTATITAKYAGNETYKPCQKSFALTVKEYTPYTSIASMLENASTTKTDIRYTFTGLSVTYVKGSYTYIHSYADGDILLYGSNLGLEQDCVYSGSLVGQLYKKNGLPEILVASADDIHAEKQEGMVAVAITIITPDELPYYINKQCAIQHAEYVSADNKNLTFKVGETTFIAYNAFGTSTDALEAGKKYTVEGFGSVYNDTYQIYPTKFTEEQEAAGFRDIKLNLMEHPEVLTGSPVYITVADDGTIGTTDNAENAAATITGQVHSYGSSNFTASVPVQGCVKITYATHDYGNDIVVTNSEGVEVAKLNTMGDKWMSNHDNVAVAYYRTNEPTTLNFSKANYNPYFAVEAIDPADLPAEVTNYNITFAAGEGVTGTVPAALEVEAGGKFTAPKNYTLYKEGYTLNGWESGDAIYLPGQEITPEADMTLTAHFVQNEVTLADRTEAVTFDFTLNGSTGQYKFEGNTGFMVTQATVNGKTIDVKADINATGGKFAYNGSGWHQVNQGTKVTVPSAKGAIIAVSTYNDGNGTSMTFAGNNGTADNNVVSYTATAQDATCEIAQISNNYWNKLTITLPVPLPTGFQDFEITNEQLSGTLDVSTLPAGVVFTGTKRNDSHGYGNVTLSVVVNGPVKFTFGGCKYANQTFTVKNAAGETLETLNPYTANCYHQDKSVITYEYKGEATTLTFATIQYLPYFKAEAFEPETPVYVIDGYWDRTAMKKLEFNEEAQAYIYEIAPTDLYFFAFATKQMTEEEANADPDWSEFAKYRYAIATGDNYATLNQETQLQNCDGTIVLNPGTYKVSVTKDWKMTITGKESGGFEYTSVYAVGNGEDNWMNGETWNPGAAANIMTKVADDVWEITFHDVTASNDRQMKFAIDGTWTTNFGGDFLGFGVETDAIYNAQNIQFSTPLEKQDITVRLDLSAYNPYTTTGAKFTIFEAHEPIVLTWDYTEADIPTKGPDNGLYYGAYVNDAAGTNNGMHGVKLNSSGYAYFAKPAVAGKLTLTIGNRKTADAFAVNVYACTIADGVATKGDLIGEVAVAESPGTGSIDIAADVTGIYIERKTSAEGVLSKIVFKEIVPRKFVDFEIPYETLTADGYTGADLPTGVTFSGSFHDGQHGYSNASLVVPVDGTVKFQISGCRYGGTFDVKNADGNVLASLNQKDAGCYNYDNPGVLTYLYVGEATTLTFANIPYLSYFKAEATEVQEAVITYKDQNGVELGTKTVYEGDAIGEIPYTEADLTIPEGEKFRGWVYTSKIKVKPTDIVTGNVSILASVTPIEEAPTVGSIQTYDLTQATFYPEDHENFSVENGAYYNNHGFDFATGGSFTVATTGKAQIVLNLCQYGSGTTIQVTNAEGILVSDNVPAKAETDGGTTIVNYEGSAGTLKFTFASQTYLHKVTVYNVSDFLAKDESGYYIVPAGDAAGLVMALNAASAEKGTKIFLPNGTYDFGEATLTGISGENVSIIGQSADKTIIVNRPPRTMEGLEKADLFLNTSTGLYLQDVTLQNDMESLGNDERAATLHDKGTKTINKNVRHLSHQDTYYSHKVGGLYYFEGGEMHGTVDYLCGNGKVYFNEVKLVNEKRSSSTISANSELYVFNNCVVENNADQYNFGRAWSDHPVCVYLNTTLLDGGEKLISSRWNLSGINCDYSIAGEYGTKNAEGQDITPASNEVTFKKENTTLQTILTAEQAATYTMEYVLGDWAATAKQEAHQLTAPPAEYANGTVTWPLPDDGSTAFMIEKNGEFVGITVGSRMDVTIDAENDILTIRSANGRGGFGPAAQVAGTATSIQAVNAAMERGEQVIYNLSGQRVNRATKGLYIINGKKIAVK